MLDGEIRPETIVRRNVTVAGMNGEKAMMCMEQGKYYGVDTVGSQIWEMLDRPMAVQELTEELTKQYEVAEALCRRDIILFLRKMHKKGLVSFVQQDTENTGTYGDVS